MKYTYNMDALVSGFVNYVLSHLMDKCMDACVIAIWSSQY